MNFSKHHEPRYRLAGLAFVVVLHVLLVWGLIEGLARKKMEVVPPPLETKIIEEAEAPEAEPPPPQPDFTPPPPPSFEPPMLDIAPPPQIQRETITRPPPPPPRPAPAPPPRRKQTVRVPPKVDFANSPIACRQPAYPSISARLGEQGTAQISLLIGVDGKVKESKVVESSGHHRLDDATVKAFSRCKFSVGTTDGVPEPSWFSVRYKWVVPR